MKDQHFLFAIGFTDCLKMTASLQWVSKNDFILKTQQRILQQTENAIHLLSHSICDCDA